MDTTGLMYTLKRNQGANVHANQRHERRGPMITESDTPRQQMGKLWRTEDTAQ